MLTLVPFLLATTTWFDVAPATESTRSHTTRSKPASPSNLPSMKFVRFVTRDDRPYAEFTLINGTDVPFFYNGYRPDDPVYSFEHWDGMHWREQVGGWCGVGLGIVELAPGKSTSFAVIHLHTIREARQVALGPTKNIRHDLCNGFCRIAAARRAPQ